MGREKSSSECEGRTARKTVVGVCTAVVNKIGVDSLLDENGSNSNLHNYIAIGCP